MDIAAAVEFARARRQSVLVTLKRDGKPQLSNVLHQTLDDGTFQVSITTDRAKHKNLLREPWSALHVASDDFWAYAVIEADVDLSPVSAAPDDPTVERLVALYRALVGEHPDWDEYRAAQVSEGRVIAHLRPTHAYGMVPVPKG